MFQRRGIDGYLVGPGLKASGRLLARPEASRHGKRHVDPLGDAPHPGDIERAAFRARRDVVEDELVGALVRIARSEEHTSELKSLMRTSYAVFCLKKKKQ